MVDLDRSQLEFVQSAAQNIRLLASAGCGKTASMLHRCRALVQRAKNRKPRFLIITFTKAATAELKDRLTSDPQFECVRDQATITTLNAYGWRRLRNSDHVNNPQLLSTPEKRYIAMKNQLRPVWLGKQQIEDAVKGRGKGARTLMTVMDNLKSMGFDHLQDVNRDLYQKRLDALEKQGLSWRIDEQFGLLTDIRVLDPGGGTEPSTSRRKFYDRFFTFWRRATASLIDQATFTFEDQKYWNYLDLKSPGPDGKPKPYVSGAARYHHIMVDEFQDINPLDLALIKVLAERHQATITIAGDDDQAIYEWRGATPEYILHPEQYLGISFRDYHLEVNYRSPKNIVELSQRLIANNENRIYKKVSAAEDANTAEIVIRRASSISERLELVTDIVKNTEPGKVAVIARLRRQLIPYQIYFASDGIPFKTAIDLDVFNSEAFDALIELLEIWKEAQQSNRRATDDAIKICNLVRRRPLSKKDDESLRKYLRKTKPQTTNEAVTELKNYDGPKLSGKTHRQLHDIAGAFVNAKQVSDAIESIGEGFDGLRFDEERAENDLWYTDPPLKQLAEIAESENLDADDLIDRITTAQEQIKEYQNSGDDDFPGWERPLHLITATRAKGKEFDTVILLDTVENIWPYQKADDQRKMESERRLFYVAFTRARQKVILLTSDSVPISRFVAELGL